MTSVIIIKFHWFLWSKNFGFHSWVSSPSFLRSEDFVLWFSFWIRTVFGSLPSWSSSIAFDLYLFWVRTGAQITASFVCVRLIWFPVYQGFCLLDSFCSVISVPLLLCFNSGYGWVFLKYSINIYIYKCISTHFYEHIYTLYIYEHFWKTEPT
jgi:hypothetical protein